MLKTLRITSILLILLMATGCQTTITTQPPAINTPIRSTSDTSGSIPESAKTNLSGAAAAETDQNLTVEDMLRYAIQDEYIARATYQAVLKKSASVKPFASIVQAESTHIDLLKPLFQSRNLQVPADHAMGTIDAPPTFQEALNTGVQAEVENIAMYERFLNQPGLPDDVRDVFNKLKNASTNHLDAFQRAGGKRP